MTDTAIHVIEGHGRTVGFVFLRMVNRRKLRPRDDIDGEVCDYKLVRKERSGLFTLPFNLHSSFTGFFENYTEAMRSYGPGVRDWR